MLKQLIQLLVNQLVPKRAVSGGGTVYGVNASSLGVPDYSSYVQVEVPDSTGPNWSTTGTYVLPYDALVVASSNGISTGQSQQPVYLAAKKGETESGIICARRTAANSVVYVSARKGDTILYTLGGIENRLRIFKLTPN